MKKNVAEIAWLAVAIGLLGLSSCSQSPAAHAAKETVEVLKPNEKRDTWDGAFVQGTRVGYSHTTAQDVGSGRVVLRTENVNHLAIRRGGETSLLDVRIVTLERPNGELLKFEAEVSMGPTPIRTTGRVGGNRLEITTTGAAARARAHVDSVVGRRPRALCDGAIAAAQTDAARRAPHDQNVRG